MAPRDEHLQALLEMPFEERAHAAQQLLESLDSESEDVGGAWTTEIERRLARIDAGEAKPLSMDSAIERLHRAAHR